MRTYRTSTTVAKAYAEKIRSGHYQGVVVIASLLAERHRETRHVCKQVRAQPSQALEDAKAFVSWAIPDAKEVAGDDTLPGSRTLQ